MFNLVLLGKLLWRFVGEREHLWHKMVVAKFGLGKEGWCSGRVGQSHSRDVWKGIWLG